MNKTKKVPLRKCVGCSESKPKKELIRIVKNKEQEVFIDETGKANGRGAYVCKDIRCL
ncbi:MAG: RNase P modulator RnpM, partial [Aedoeadaptatus pacaensis]